MKEIQQQSASQAAAANKPEQAASMWRELRAFADRAEAQGFMLTAFYEGRQQRATTEGLQTVELQTFVPHSWNENTFVNILHFTSEEMQSPFIHIISRIVGKTDPQRNIYIHVGKDGTQKVRALVKEGETWVGREAQLTADELELIRLTGQASAVPYTVLQDYGSAYTFKDQVQIGNGNRPQDGIGIDGVNERGWTLYDGGLSMFVETLKQVPERTFVSSTELLIAGPLAEAPRMFRAITQPPPPSTPQEK